MKQLKIRESLWNKIVSGEKKFEFRKLEKGLESGEYEFVSIDGEIDKCNLWPKYNIHNNIKSGTCGEFIPNKKFGKVNLKPKYVNPELVNFTWCQNDPCVLDGEFCGCENKNFKTFEWGFVSQGKIDEDEWFYDRVNDNDLFEEGIPIEIDQETYDFVKENYVDKKIDFMVYEISKVEEY